MMLPCNNRIDRSQSKQRKIITLNYINYNKKKLEARKELALDRRKDPLQEIRILWGHVSNSFIEIKDLFC